MSTVLLARCSRNGLEIILLLHDIWRRERSRARVREKKIERRSPMRVSGGSLTYFLQEYLFQSPLLQRVPVYHQSVVRGSELPEHQQSTDSSQQTLLESQNLFLNGLRRVLSGICSRLFDSMIASHWKVERSRADCLRRYASLFGHQQFLEFSLVEQLDCSDIWLQCHSSLEQWKRIG